MLFHSRRNREYWNACKEVQTEENILEVQRVPLGSPRFRKQVENFLVANGLRMEVVDDYFCVLEEDGSMLAGAGLSGDVIKCVAVDASARSRGLVAPLVSHIIAFASEKGISNLKVFTKPDNEAIFASLGFHTIARAPLAILMENGRGLEDYLRILSSSLRSEACASETSSTPLRPRGGLRGVPLRLPESLRSVAVEDELESGLASPDRGRPRHARGRGPLAERVGGAERSEESGLSEPDDKSPSRLKSAVPAASTVTGVIVMNANPFTLGHKYLIEKAKEQVDNLFVIPVKEDVSLFPYEERLEMIRSGCEGLATVLEGSDYQISAATFPTYFLKELSEASETQMLLDLDLFGRHIAPAIGATVRFVGTEPSDPLTARYNELMKEVLPSYGISVVEIPRLKVPESAVGLGTKSAAASPERSRREGVSYAGCVQASDVRKSLKKWSFQTAVALTPPTTWPYLVAELIARALRMELDTPLKPGLVDRESTGAHSDMDYPLMSGSIDVIRRSFIRHLPMLLLRRSTAIEDSATLGSIRGGTGALLCEASGGAERSEASERRYSTAVGDVLRIVKFGKAIEADVLEYTGGVNTYRGAIFALGLAAIAALEIARDSQLDEYQDNRQECLEDNNRTLFDNILIDSSLHFTALELSDRIAALSSLIAAGNDSHGARAVKEHGVKGALQMAQEGYKSLFEDWLPFYRSVSADWQGLDVVSARAAGLRQSADVASVSSAGAAGLRPYSAAASPERERRAKREWTRPCPAGTAESVKAGTAERTMAGTAEGTAVGTVKRTVAGTAESAVLQKTLLRIMSTLDDTCVIHRVGYQRAQEVKEEAKALLEDFSEEGLRKMKQSYDAEGISPGGAADMLALTILIDSLTQ